MQAHSDGSTACLGHSIFLIRFSAVLPDSAVRLSAVVGRFAGRIRAQRGAKDSSMHGERLSSATNDSA